MKKILSLVIGVLLISVSANADSSLVSAVRMGLLAQVHADNVINWKVGEFAESDMSLNFFGSDQNIGKVTKTATSEQGNAIWLKTEISGQVSKVEEVLLDRADGHILEYREDGQKKDIPNQKLEIISQDATKITVPAGTFDVIHIVAKSDQAPKIEIWSNMRDISLDGAAQMAIQTQFGTMTMKLTKFGGR